MIGRAGEDFGETCIRGHWSHTVWRPQGGSSKEAKEDHSGQRGGTKEGTNGRDHDFDDEKG